MASSSSSPTSSSAPAKSSQPLHNFELSPMLRWNNNREGTSSGSHRRWRSAKPPHPQRPYDFPASPFRRSPPRNSFTPPRGSFMPPQPRFDSRMRDFSAPPPPRFQSHPPRAATPSRDQQPAAADDEINESAAFDEEFQRLSLLREEEMRNYRGRDWWSEEGRSDITYRRNPHRRSGFSTPPARFGSSSSSSSFPDGRRHDAARGDFDAYHRNPYRRPSFAPTGEAEAYNRQPFRFTSEPEEYRSDTYRRDSYRRTGFSPPMRQPYSPTSEGRRSGFSPPKRHEAHGYPRYPYANNSGFSSPPPFYPASSRAPEDEAYPRRQPLFSTSRTVAEAEPNPNPNPNPRLPPRKFASSSNPEEKSKGKSKVVEEANAFASPTTATGVAISSIPEERKAEKVGAEIPKKEVRKPSFAPSSSSSAEAKLLKKGKAAVEVGEAGVKDSGKGKREEEKAETGIKADDKVHDEEIKVWNLRPRNVKGKGKANTGGGDKGSSTPAGAKKGGGAAKAPAGVKGGGGEKKEKKKLSVQISLTKEEIEEDIFALTGARPSRRPKKRPKNVQKELDAVFPGLWLVNITPDSYKVSESSLK